MEEGNKELTEGIRKRNKGLSTLRGDKEKKEKGHREEQGNCKYISSVDC